MNMLSMPFCYFNYDIQINNVPGTPPGINNAENAGAEKAACSPLSHQQKTEEKPIFRTSYSIMRAWGSLLIILPLPSYLITALAYMLIEEGKSLQGLYLVLVFVLPAILIIIDTVLLEEICFYKDRVTKSWMIFGTKTIYYSKAKVFDPWGGAKYFTSSIQIKETDESGKTSIMHIPIMTIAFFIPKNEFIKMQGILDYLTNYSKENPRLIVKHIIIEEEL